MSSEQVQDPLAQAFVQLLLHAKHGVCENVNICSGQPVRIEDVVHTLARLCAADPTAVLQLATARPNDPPMLVGDNSKLLAMGWTQQWSLEQGMQATVEAARAAFK